MRQERNIKQHTIKPEELWNTEHWQNTEKLTEHWNAGGTMKHWWNNWNTTEKCNMRRTTE